MIKHFFLSIGIIVSIISCKTNNASSHQDNVLLAKQESCSLSSDKQDAMIFENIRSYKHRSDVHISPLPDIDSVTDHWHIMMKAVVNESIIIDQEDSYADNSVFLEALCDGAIVCDMLEIRASMFPIFYGEKAKFTLAGSRIAYISDDYFDIFFDFLQAGPGSDYGSIINMRVHRDGSIKWREVFYAMGDEHLFTITKNRIGGDNDVEFVKWSSEKPFAVYDYPNGNIVYVHNCSWYHTTAIEVVETGEEMIKVRIYGTDYLKTNFLYEGWILKNIQLSGYLPLEFTLYEQADYSSKKTDLKWQDIRTDEYDVIDITDSWVNIKVQSGNKTILGWLPLSK